VFSAVYGGNSRVKQHHSGVVGRVLDKEMGKEFFRALGHSASPSLMLGDARLVVGGCPETSDSGQRNLLKPALENQPFAASRRQGFLGKV